MLGVNFSRISEKGADEQAQILGELMDLFKAGRHPDALRRLIDLATFKNANPDPDFIKRAALYYLALLSYELGGSELSRDIGKIHGPVRPDYPPLEFGWHQHKLIGLLSHRENAKNAQVPSILIFALQKSASAFLSDLLSQILGSAVVNVDIGDQLINEDLLRSFAGGGCVTHNHILPRTQNFELLDKVWDGPVFIQIRHPCEAIWSMYHHVKERIGETEFVTIAATIYPEFVDFIDGWLQASDDDRRNITFIRYEEISADAGAVVRKIFDRVGIDRRIYENWLASNAVPKSANFRKGDPTDWQRNMPHDLQRELIAKTPDSVLALIDSAT